MQQPRPNLETPFDATAHGYDAAFTETAVGKMQRAVVHDFLLKNFLFAASNSLNVLELNCGTGEDAVWLARRGCHVLATDVSPEMVSIARAKTQQNGLENLLETTVCAVENLPIPGRQFDLVFSNFGGLNCACPEDLRRFGEEVLPRILKPGGHFVTVVMGRFCWWEVLYFLMKLNLRTAFRRFSKKPVLAKLNENTSVPTWYFSPGEFCKLLKINVSGTNLKIQPVGFWLPPSYLDPFLRRFPTLLRALDFLEKKCRGKCWAWGSDHFLVDVKF